MDGKIYYSLSVGGFLMDAIHGADNIPADAKEISKATYLDLLSKQALGWSLMPSPGGTLMAVEPEPAGVVVPASVTARQARLALLQRGHLQAVTETIEALSEPERSAARIEWEFAATVDRVSPLVATLAAALDLTDADLDDLFVTAGAL